MTTLTPNAEKLLQEILDNRLQSGNCSTDYWKKRFEGLGFMEDSLLRSTFKELSDTEMIAVFWAGNVPCEMVEFRADHYAEIEDEAVMRSALIAVRESIRDKPLLVTFRTKREGGERQIDPEAYFQLNGKAAALAAEGLTDLVDLELG